MIRYDAPSTRYENVRSHATKTAMYGVSHAISYSPDIWFMKNWPRPYSLSPFWGTPQDEPLFIVKPLEVPTEDYQQTNRSPSAAKIAKISCRENIRQKPGSLSLLVLLVKVAEKKTIFDFIGSKNWRFFGYKTLIPCRWKLCPRVQPIKIPRSRCSPGLV